MDFEQLIGHRIGLTARCFGGYFIKELRQHNLSFEQGIILFVISKDSNPSISHIAKEIHKDKATISREVNSLIAKGFIQKEPSPHDKRAQHLSLTPSGQSALDMVLHKIHALDQLVLQSFSQEQLDNCFAVLDSMREIIETYLQENGEGDKALQCTTKRCR